MKIYMIAEKRQHCRPALLSLEKPPSKINIYLFHQLTQSSVTVDTNLLGPLYYTHKKKITKICFKK